MAKRKKKKRPRPGHDPVPAPVAEPAADVPAEPEVTVRDLRVSGWLLIAAFPVMVALGRWFWGG